MGWPSWGCCFSIWCSEDALLCKPHEHPLCILLGGSDEPPEMQTWRGKWLQEGRPSRPSFCTEKPQPLAGEGESHLGRLGCSGWSEHSQTHLIQTCCLVIQATGNRVGARLQLCPAFLSAAAAHIAACVGNGTRRREAEVEKRVCPWRSPWSWLSQYWA